MDLPQTPNNNLFVGECPALCVGFKWKHWLSGTLAPPPPPGWIDPRWGRGQETYGEDPTLTSAITGAVVAALQNGDDPNYNKMIATSKHWLAYHVCVPACLGVHVCLRLVALTMTMPPPLLTPATCRDSWGTDPQYRLSHSFNLSETDIAQYYVKPFAAAVNSNVSAIMCAYDGTNVSAPLPLWPNPTGPEPWGVPQ